MKIHVAMKSLLFSEALCLALNRDANRYQAQIHQHPAPAEPFEPDLILVDHECLRHDSFQSWTKGKVLLIDTGLQEEEIIYLMRVHKLYGVFSLDSDFHQLEKAIAVINGGQIWIGNERLKVILHGRDSERPSIAIEKLSNKEGQIVELVVEGFKNREIASRLFLSEQTIKSHLVPCNSGVFV